jgi:hypothetical protein
MKENKGDESANMLQKMQNNKRKAKLNEDDELDGAVSRRDNEE